MNVTKLCAFRLENVFVYTAISINCLKKKVNYYIKYYRRSSLAFSVCCHFSESKSSSPLHMDPVFVSAIRDFRVKKIVPRCTKLIEGFFRDNIDFAKIQHTIMIVGVPNVGMYKQTHLYKKYLIRIVRISEETSLKKMSIMSWLIIRRPVNASLS